MRIRRRVPRPDLDGNRAILDPRTGPTTIRIDMMTTRTIVGLLVGLVAAGGCHQPQAPVERTAQRYLVADEEQFDSLWEACQTVLRRNHFRLDRVDRRAGTITTFPVTSQQFFEFWRHDVDTAYDLARSSLSTERRRVTVQVNREEANPLECVVRVIVNKERLSAPERRFNNSAAVLRLYGSDLPGEGGQPRLTREEDYWIDQGRDGAMERWILGRIAERADYVQASPASAEPSSS